MGTTSSKKQGDTMLNVEIIEKTIVINKISLYREQKKISDLKMKGQSNIIIITDYVSPNLLRNKSIKYKSKSNAKGGSGLSLLN